MLTGKACGYLARQKEEEGFGKEQLARKSYLANNSRGLVKQNKKTIPLIARVSARGGSRMMHGTGSSVLDGWTHGRKVMGSIPSRSSRRISFSRVNFLC